MISASGQVYDGRAGLVVDIYASNYGDTPLFESVPVVENETTEDWEWSLSDEEPMYKKDLLGVYLVVRDIATGNTSRPSETVSYFTNWSNITSQ